MYILGDVRPGAASASVAAGLCADGDANGPHLSPEHIHQVSRSVSVCVCVCAVSYTHLTLPTNIAV